MATIRLFVALCWATWAFAACSHVPPVVVDCAQEVSAGLLPAIESALTSADYVSELAKLVAKYGECIIRKGVILITGEAKRDMAAAPNDVNARLKVEHGQKWLAAHPGA